MCTSARDTSPYTLKKLVVRICLCVAFHKQAYDSVSARSSLCSYATVKLNTTRFTRPRARLTLWDNSPVRKVVFKAARDQRKIVEPFTASVLSSS